MSFDKKNEEKIFSVLQSLKHGNYSGQSFSEDEIDLVKDLTIGDLVIYFEMGVEESANVLKSISIICKKNLARGFRESSQVKESKLVSKIKKLIKEEIDVSYLPAPTDNYHPFENDDGGYTFEDSDSSEQIGMIKSNLYSIYTKAQSLHDMIGDQDDLPEWVQEKIAVANENIRTISDYLVYEYKHVD